MESLYVICLYVGVQRLQIMNQMKTTKNGENGEKWHFPGSIFPGQRTALVG